MTVAIMTDSTAWLPDDVLEKRGVTVVPLQVIIDDESFDDGSDAATPQIVAEALKGGQKVSTSRPPPEVFADHYRHAIAMGATEIVAIHLSGDISGTFESAQVAARDCAVPVHLVDTRQIGVGTGYAVLSAADLRDAGESGEAMAAAASSRALATKTLLYVDTLEYLRRGGRIGTASALLGGALAVKPLLQIEDGRPAPLDRVRTSGKALARLGDHAVTAAGDEQVEVCVAHLVNPERAEGLAERLSERLADNLDGRDVACTELGPVLGAHVGPGMVAVCIAPMSYPQAQN